MHTNTIPTPEKGCNPYRPSNGDEGIWFESQFCDRCEKEAAYRDTDGQASACDIHCRALAFARLDNGFPAEWIEDADGPRCTAFRVEGTPSDEQMTRDRERYEAAMAEMRAAQGRQS